MILNHLELQLARFTNCEVSNDICKNIKHITYLYDNDCHNVIMTIVMMMRKIPLINNKRLKDHLQ